MTVKTTVFDLAPEYGYITDKALADAMGITPYMVCRVKSSEQKITATFIAGARRAFPDKSLDELFVVEQDAEAVA